MSKETKIAVSEFISKGKLEKINKIIEKSDNTEDAYDKIENLLMEDFTTKSLGTNRLILLSNSKKYKHLIFKVAGDSHGIEANYREFYNGDLCEKRLTKSYSISNNGVFLVQERVTPFTSDMMKKYKKDVRKMLKHLEDKILLVDCKLSNFANFGIRKNGDIVLLDHGDTIPLTMYKNGKVVNLMEESNVSLRCKEYKKGTLTSKNPEPCNGKLEYSKNYDYFICKKCGAHVPIHDAYKEFYGYARLSSDADSKYLLSFQDGFDPEEYAKQVQSSIKQYCEDTMNNNTNKKENSEMRKQIKGQTCQQIRGYWLPIKSDKQFATVKYLAVKRGELDPAEYLKFLGLDPDDYKMNHEDHQNSKKEKYNNDKYIPMVTKKLMEMAKDGETVEITDPQKYHRNGLFHMVKIDDIGDIDSFSIRDNIYTINKAMRYVKGAAYTFFDKKYFYIKLESDLEPEEDNKETDEYDVITEESDQDNDTEETNYHTEEINGYYQFVEDEDETDNDKEDDNNEDETDESDDVDLRGKTIITVKDLLSLEFMSYDGRECFKYNDYYIPIDIINEYYNTKYGFVLPDAETILKDHNCNKDDFIISRDTEDEDYDYIKRIDLFIDTLSFTTLHYILDKNVLYDFISNHDNDITIYQGIVHIIDIIKEFERYNEKFGDDMDIEENVNYIHDQLLNVSEGLEILIDSNEYNNSDKVNLINNVLIETILTLIYRSINTIIRVLKESVNNELIKDRLTYLFKYDFDDAELSRIKTHIGNMINIVDNDDHSEDNDTNIDVPIDANEVSITNVNKNNEIIRLALSSVDNINLDINDIKGKKFIINVPLADGTTANATVDLHNIITRNLGNVIAKDLV